MTLQVKLSVLVKPFFDLQLTATVGNYRAQELFESGLRRLDGGRRIDQWVM
ncbi:hypothetical protein [Mycolicibacterium sp. 120270]|uniref:hypothetical protein n=1 Tax=Mycolicibacterium sp. 120270 TaxID=3090600 RepID=UPI00299D3B94|nr:hypothetical protein [Mycolicibacterium sp. 120270]MDX1886321.1 hypothetical protein [Mycolicibacterium sp. 120270]